MMELSISDFIIKYNTQTDYFNNGSLCFYGHWFGRPHDNIHRLVNSTFNSEEKILTLTFNEKETLTIHNPKKITLFTDKLTITFADKIIWKWFYYGKPQTDENLYFIEILRKDQSLIGRSNANWHKTDFRDLDINSPALLWT